MNSFQDVKKAKSVTLTIPGITNGTKIHHSNWRLLQPSMTAASSSSRGTASKLWRMRKMLNGN